MHERVYEYDENDNLIGYHPTVRLYRKDEIPVFLQHGKFYNGSEELKSIPDWLGEELIKVPDSVLKHHEVSDGYIKALRNKYGSNKSENQVVK